MLIVALLTGCTDPLPGLAAPDTALLSDSAQPGCSLVVEQVFTDTGPQNGLTVTSDADQVAVEVISRDVPFGGDTHRIISDLSMHDGVGAVHYLPLETDVDITVTGLDAAGAVCALAAMSTDTEGSDKAGVQPFTPPSLPGSIQARPGRLDTRIALDTRAEQPHTAANYGVLYSEDDGEDAHSNAMMVYGPGGAILYARDISFKIEDESGSIIGEITAAMDFRLGTDGTVWVANEYALTALGPGFLRIDPTQGTFSMVANFPGRNLHNAFAARESGEGVDIIGIESVVESGGRKATPITFSADPSLKTSQQTPAISELFGRDCLLPGYADEIYFNFVDFNAPDDDRVVFTHYDRRTTEDGEDAYSFSGTFDRGTQALRVWYNAGADLSVLHGEGCPGTVTLTAMSDPAPGRKQHRFVHAVRQTDGDVVGIYNLNSTGAASDAHVTADFFVDGDVPEALCTYTPPALDTGGEILAGIVMDYGGAVTARQGGGLDFLEDSTASTYYGNVIRFDTFEVEARGDGMCPPLSVVYAADPAPTFESRWGHRFTALQDGDQTTYHPGD
ncbi:MAG: hypothetical protein ACI8RZ_003594 [Myxococcota bacterium]|jgi:hypothetical protein